LSDSGDEPHPGVPWRELSVGASYRTGARTITEADLVQFVAYGGYTEPLFLDARRGRPDGSPGRAVPAMLTLSYADGLVLQTRMLHRTGIALLDVNMEVKAAVGVGDTIEVEVTIDAIRPTSDDLRAVISSTNVVTNQEGATVLVYRPTRLQR
jgi:acyl dehydratase